MLALLACSDDTSFPEALFTGSALDGPSQCQRYLPNDIGEG